MERRQLADRRQEHLFVSNDRRTGPYDRRGAGSRREEILAEREKVERIRAFKAKNKTVSASEPLFTKKRLLFLGLALVAIVAVLLLMQ